MLHNFTTVGDQVVRKPEPENVDLSANQFFTAYTTNEVKWAGAGAGGSGAVPFEVQTAMQSTALGCGSPIAQPDGSALGQSCWLVIIPRGTADSGVPNITRSGLYWDAWEHHLAVKLEFKPLGVRCQIGDAERQLAGSELVAGAIASWQPGLCRGDGGAPFVLSEGTEGDAAVRAAGTEPSPLALTSRPLDMSRVPYHTTDPLTYAPVALAGIAISFAVDREPHPNTENQDYRDRAGLPFTDMKLTPRLVAKLLTASYRDSLPNGADKDHLGRDTDGDGKMDSWNPRTIVWDPEFRAINDPEWTEQVIIGASIADALTPSGRSDAAVRLWEYVLADPDARAWLEGADDGHGMFVNHWYSTNAEHNPTGFGLALPLDNFPKADPVEKPDQTQADGTGPINLVTWRPYTHSFADGAYHVLRGDGMILGNWDGLAVPPKFGKAVRELFGSQKVIGVTTTPAAELYQTVTASLRNPAGQFVAPTQDSLAAAAAAMTPTSTQQNVMQYDLNGDAARAASSSYALTMPVYAALNPKQTDAEERAVYANLIRYAVKDGQDPGTDVGGCPPATHRCPRAGSAAHSQQPTPSRRAGPRSLRLPAPVAVVPAGTPSHRPEVRGLRHRPPLPERRHRHPEKYPPSRSSPAKSRVRRSGDARRPRNRGDGRRRAPRNRGGTGLGPRRGGDHSPAKADVILPHSTGTAVLCQRSPGCSPPPMNLCEGQEISLKLLIKLDGPQVGAAKPSTFPSGRLSHLNP